MKLRCKRLTRLTYAYSKKWEHLHAALALHFAYYNFCRVHRSLRVTPAMESGITDQPAHPTPDTTWSPAECSGRAAALEVFAAARS